MIMYHKVWSLFHIRLVKLEWWEGTITYCISAHRCTYQAILVVVLNHTTLLDATFHSAYCKHSDRYTTMKVLNHHSVMHYHPDCCSKSFLNLNVTLIIQYDLYISYSFSQFP